MVVWPTAAGVPVVGQNTWPFLGTIFKGDSIWSVSSNLHSRLPAPCDALSFITTPKLTVRQLTFRKHKRSQVPCSPGTSTMPDQITFSLPWNPLSFSQGRNCNGMQPIKHRLLRTGSYSVFTLSLAEDDGKVLSSLNAMRAG